MIDAAKVHVDAIDDSRPNADAHRVSANLYSLLAQRTRGKAQTICRLLESSRAGFEAWRHIWAEYQPQGHEPARALLAAIIQPRWWHAQEHKSRPFLDVLLDWEQLISKYTDGSG